MTIVAYRNGIMAADGACWINDSQITRMQKIYRLKGGLVGMAGDVEVISQFIEWLKDGADEDEFPLGNYESIVVNPSGRVTLFEGGSYCPVPLRAQYAAIGAGIDYALGAMFAGADARLAVKAAIAYNAKCRGPISVFHLRTPSSEKRRMSSHDLQDHPVL